MDETYIKVKGEWVYLYRAVDSHGDTLDFSQYIFYEKAVSLRGELANDNETHRFERYGKLICAWLPAFVLM
jgi:transposase-like protein